MGVAVVEGGGGCALAPAIVDPVAPAPNATNPTTAAQIAPMRLLLKRVFPFVVGPTGTYGEKVNRAQRSHEHRSHAQKTLLPSGCVYRRSVDNLFTSNAHASVTSVPLPRESHGLMFGGVRSG